MVRLQCAGPGDVDVGAEGSRHTVDMGSQVLVVLQLGEVLSFCDLGLDALLPLGVGKGLGALYARCAMLLCVPPARGDDSLIDGVVVWANQVDIGGGVGGIVWFEMGRDGMSYLVVGLADLRGCLVASVGGRGAS